SGHHQTERRPAIQLHRPQDLPCRGRRAKLPAEFPPHRPHRSTPPRSRAPGQAVLPPGQGGSRRPHQGDAQPAMNSATDWLANISVKWVLVVAGLLLVFRMSLPRMRTLPKQWADSTAEFVESALIAIVLVFLVIRPFVVQAFYIPSGSMLDTLHIEDRILVNKFLYHFRPPKRDDIVVFHAPPVASPDEKDFIKRVIGQPGDTVQVTPDTVTVDGKPAVELTDDPGNSSVNFMHSIQHGLRWVDKEHPPRVENN